MVHWSAKIDEFCTYNSKMLSVLVFTSGENNTFCKNKIIPFSESIHHRSTAIWSHLQRNDNAANEVLGQMSDLNGISARRLIWLCIDHFLQDVQHACRGVGDRGARAKDGAAAMLIQEIVILRRNDSARHHDDVRPTHRLQFLDQLGDESLVSGGERRDSHHVHVGIDGLLRGLARSGEKGTNVDVESHVSETRSDDFTSSIMAILSDFGDENPRSSSFLLRKLFDPLHDDVNFRGSSVFRLVSAADETVLRHVTTPHFLQRP